MEFGIAVNTPGQILYKVDPDGDLYLNGFWSTKHGLEADLLRHFPDDAWARLGARNAARDLLEIQRTAKELMETQKQDTLQDMDRRHVEGRFEAILKGVPVAHGSHSRNSESVQFDCEALWERIKAYLIGIKAQRPAWLDDYDLTGL